MHHFRIAGDHYRRMFEPHPQHADSYRDMGLIMTYRSHAPNENDRQVDLLMRNVISFVARPNSTYVVRHESLAYKRF